MHRNVISVLTLYVIPSRYDSVLSIYHIVGQQHGEWLLIQSTTTICALESYELERHAIDTIPIGLFEEKDVRFKY